MIILVHEIPMLFETLKINSEASLKHYQVINDTKSFSPDVVIYRYDTEPPLNIAISNTIKLGLDIALPCHITHLLSIIESKSISQEYILIENIKINLVTKNIVKQDTVINLTEKEIALLEYLFKQQGVGINPQELITKIWHYSEESETATLDAHIHRLRKKLSAIDLGHAIQKKKGLYYFIVEEI